MKLDYNNAEAAARVGQNLDLNRAKTGLNEDKRTQTSEFLKGFKNVNQRGKSAPQRFRREELSGPDTPAFEEP